MNPRVAIVIGSTRPTRICDALALGLLHVLAHLGELDYDVLDLAVVNLPFLDEPHPPAHGGYAHEHTRAWSRTVDSFGAFVFVLPQYNWGYPAVLKNALDFLYAEWSDKPAGIVTYGTHGGGKAADQLRLVLRGLGMRPVDHDIRMSLTSADVDGDGKPIDVTATVAGHLPAVRALHAEILADLHRPR